MGRRLGQYRVVEKVGQGGMGCVFKAQDTALNRLVALKVLISGPLSDPRVAERFQREARCLARLSHPNLLHVYNVGTQDDLHYFAMELLEGAPLSAMVRQRGRLPPQEALVLAGQILAALDYIHRQGVTHRDIKSSNIMICADRAVLMDFGLAKEEQTPGLTTEGVVLGTPEYMAPEQAEGRPCGPATDIYSFGIVFFEMLTGQVPFTGRSALSIIRQHLDTPAPALDTRLPGADPRLVAAVSRCLAKKPEERYGSCRAVATDLVGVCPTPELSQLAGAGASAPTWRQSAPTMPLDSAPAPAMAAPAGEAQAPRRSPWPWILLGFAGAVFLGLVLWRFVRPGTWRAGPQQVVRIEAGPNRGQEIRWEFRGGPDPASWVHVIQTRRPDGTWAPPRRLSHDEFIKQYPQLRLVLPRGSAPP
jgi:serine/threonine-protein kinase